MVYLADEFERLVLQAHMFANMSAIMFAKMSPLKRFGPGPGALTV